MKKLLLRIKERWNAETPRLWKWVRNASATIGTVSTAILVAENTAGGIMSHTSATLLSWGVALGAGMAAFAQTREKGGSDEGK